MLLVVTSFLLPPTAGEKITLNSICFLGINHMYYIYRHVWSSYGASQFADWTWSSSTQTFYVLSYPNHAVKKTPCLSCHILTMVPSLLPLHDLLPIKLAGNGRPHASYSPLLLKYGWILMTMLAMLIMTMAIIKRMRESNKLKIWWTKIPLSEGAK